MSRNPPSAFRRRPTGCAPHRIYSAGRRADEPNREHTVHVPDQDLPENPYQPAGFPHIRRHADLVRSAGQYFSEGLLRRSQHDPAFHRHLLRVVLYPGHDPVRRVRPVHRGEPLRQPAPGARRFQAGLRHLVLDLDDVHRRHGHRAGLLRRVRAPVALQEPAGGRWQHACGRRIGDELHVLPLGPASLGDLYRAGPVAGLFRLSA